MIRMPSDRFLRSSALFVAQGFGIGRIPIAPGTFGSAAGMLWFWLLLSSSNPWIFAVGLSFGIVVAVVTGGVAEKTLGQKDPSSVVVDEIAAVPVCFAGWVFMLLLQTGQMPVANYFFQRSILPWTLSVAAAFRVFDILKPWPIGRSQSLPGGLGIAVDDLMAGIYVNGCVAVFLLAPGLFTVN